jgi:hypothetical protein
MRKIFLILAVALAVGCGDDGDDAPGSAGGGGGSAGSTGGTAGSGGAGAGGSGAGGTAAGAGGSDAGQSGAGGSDAGAAGEGGSAGDAGAAGEGGAAGSAAGSAGAGAGPIESLAAIQKDIFDLSCSFSSCHSAQGKKGNLVLGKSDTVTSASVHAAMVGVAADIDAKLTLVKPGDSEGSLLIAKLKSNKADGFKGTSCDESMNICGDPMPQGQPRLSDERLQRIERWINQGANNN